MRLFLPVSLCLAGAVGLVPGAGPAFAQGEPECAGGGRDFPLTTRIRGGPRSYEAGGGFGTWYLDLTNTTRRTCSGVHPVVVLVDEKRALKPEQPRLEFFEGNGTRPHPVRLETTDEDELVGAFDDGFPGFTVGPGRTVTVEVRLAVTSDAVPNEITVNAAVVQRHDDDGDWIGESNAYRFGIDADPVPPEPTPEPEPGREPHPDGHASVAPGAGVPFADELADTGLGPAGGALAAATAVFLAAFGALLVARRRR
ncbi:hypothetical protein GR925_07795 [Streptomyces sp. HUCO-GS316]|uniref:hypothetical protein n=1 Tax=Streptomyces sp. HUCO-GS316 TaxID=2692198 RepID=UPI00136C26FC|nr:hypothetical protein [Streptomyces sp. HUCO-GS316]MXM63352.1 hypothetical protein [Streptomyces sp. HUCO-GS316]